MTYEAADGNPKARAAVQRVTADLELEINFDLIERRRSIRPIPCPEAVEHNDEESWSTWSELMALPVEQTASEALATLRELLRRKVQPGDSR
jgi:hypothetical protein